MGHKQEIHLIPPEVQPLQRQEGLTLPCAICLVLSKHHTTSGSCTAACTWGHTSANPHWGCIQWQHPRCQLGLVIASMTQAGWLSTPSLFLLQEGLFHSTAGNQAGSPATQQATHAAFLTAKVQPGGCSCGDKFISLKRHTLKPPWRKATHHHHPSPYSPWCRNHPFSSGQEHITQSQGCMQVKNWLKEEMGTILCPCYRTYSTKRHHNDGSKPSPPFI